MEFLPHAGHYGALYPTVWHQILTGPSKVAAVITSLDIRKTRLGQWKWCFQATRVKWQNEAQTRICVTTCPSHDPVSLSVTDGFEGSAGRCLQEGNQASQVLKISRNQRRGEERRESPGGLE